MTLQSTTLGVFVEDVSADNPVISLPPRRFEGFMHGVVVEYFAPLMGADGEENDWGSVDLFDRRMVRRMFAVCIIRFPWWRDDVLIVRGQPT